MAAAGCAHIYQQNTDPAPPQNSKHGGLPQLKVGEGISYVLADKSCETDAGKVGKVGEEPL